MVGVGVGGEGYTVIYLKAKRIMPVTYSQIAQKDDNYISNILWYIWYILNIYCKREREW